MTRIEALVIAAALALVASGGKVVVSTGAGGGSSTGTAGGTPCEGNSDCPANGVCISGTCAPGCNGNLSEPCGKGLVCDTCASSSCPTCDDCIGACLPAKPGQCDDHDDCASDEVCLYGMEICAPACDSTNSTCANPNQVCDGCATSSCPGCEDCRGACVQGV
jgi:hypothetical protein